MTRALEEIYCARIRGAGSHGSWEPSSAWVLPGCYGEFRRGVFYPKDPLHTLGYNYDLVAGAEVIENIQTSSVRALESATAAAIGDPIGYVLSAKAEVTYAVERGDEVLLLMERGRWWSVQNEDALLQQVRDHIEDWPLGYAVILRSFVTPCGVVGISSRSTSGFTVGLDASGTPLLAATTSGGGRFARRAAHAVRRTFMLPGERAADVQPTDTDPTQLRRSAYTPLFNRCYRVRKKLWKPFGRPELITLDGHPASGIIARSDPVDLLYDSSRATVSLADIRSMTVGDLFEEVTPELMSEEVEAEWSSELFELAISRLPRKFLPEPGAGTIESVSLDLLQEGVSAVEHPQESTSADG
jgi:hypothetical protein